MTVYYSSEVTQIDKHGEMYQSGNAVATVCGVQNTWYEVANFSEGLTDNFTFASNALTALITGDYEVNWYCGALAATANKVFEFAVSVNDTIITKCLVQRKFTTTTDAGAMAGVCLLNLNAGDVIKFEVRNITDGTNITIVDCNVLVHEIG